MDGRDDSHYGCLATGHNLAQGETTDSRSGERREEKDGGSEQVKTGGMVGHDKGKERTGQGAGQ